MRKFKSAGRQQPIPVSSSKKLQVTTEFQSDYSLPSRQSQTQSSLEQTEMKRQIQALAEQYEHYYKDRVYLAFESEGALPGPPPQWIDEGDTEERDRLGVRQERYEDDRAVQVDLRQFENTPSRYISIKSSPITTSARSRKSSLSASHISTPYKPSQDSVLSFLKTSTDTLAQALSSLGGFTNNMEQLMGNLSATTQALHSSIRTLEASQQPTPSPGYSHRGRGYET